MAKMETETIAFRLSKEAAEKLREIAQSRNITVSDLVRGALYRELPNLPREGSWLKWGLVGLAVYTLFRALKRRA